MKAETSLLIEVATSLYEALEEKGVDDICPEDRAILTKQIYDHYRTSTGKLSKDFVMNTIDGWIIRKRP